MLRVAILGCLGLSACLDSKVLSDFDVELVVRAPVNEDPLDTDANTLLTVRESDAVTVTTLDDGLALDGAHPLTDAWLGVLVSTVTEAPEPGELVAFGEVGPFTLAKGDEPVVASVLVAELGRVGDLDRLPDGRRADGAALAVTSTGQVVTFGGVFEGEPVGMVRRIEDLDGGEWTFADTTNLPAALYGSAATVVDWNGREAVLVTGGRADPDDVTRNSATAALFTPDDGFVSWTGTGRQARSGHRSVRLSNGRVLLVGGYEGETDGGLAAQASFEVYDPGFQVFNLGSRPLDVPSVGFALADVAEEGVLVCGGHTVEDRDGADVAVPSDACDWISPLAEVRSAAPLPEARTGLAMAAVGTRHVLATGGLAGEHTVDATTDAVPTVWLYTLASDSWQELTPLSAGRAWHAAIPMPDERVLLVGGTSSGGPLADGVGTPISCVDVYDPVDRVIIAGGCGGTGGGANPLVAWHPNHGALVFSGTDELGNGGQSYGILPFGPLF